MAQRRKKLELVTAPAETQTEAKPKTKRKRKSAKEEVLLLKEDGTAEEVEFEIPPPLKKSRVVSEDLLNDLEGELKLKEKLKQIQEAYTNLIATMVSAKERQIAARLKLQTAWATLQNAIEETIPAQGTVEEIAVATSTKLHRTELAWQDYEEAKGWAREETRHISNDLKVAKARLDRTIESAESKQTTMFD